jgi:hypothetical protein
MPPILVLCVSNVCALSLVKHNCDFFFPLAVLDIPNILHVGSCQRFMSHVCHKTMIPTCLT